ncbi:calcium-binding protein [Mesorhizobium sp. LHD-90]|uniref:calcium-binding protein n=1 Tax=Mesorhizobium sp. LHD-90 TaxID=3071414 RepID=UPI0027E21515|nr:calcium-binding protein [Mesorhizobium sp. LHD-90]MDQ6434536.1 calcium-binding protein [Mesorhizobium sp. LHD-90]
MTTYSFPRGFAPTTISSFSSSDKIDLSAFNIADFAALSGYLVIGGGNSVLTFKWMGQVEQITVEAYALSAADFIFNTSPADLTVNGTSGIDYIFGGNGNDRLDGRGGGTTSSQGTTDWLSGGNGNDLYFVRRPSDLVIEHAGEGSADRVLVATGSGYTLPAGAEIELLTTTNSTATAQTNLQGNELGQTIIGNAGVNRITDASGNNQWTTPGDVLIGLAGNDQYTVSGAFTRVVEAAGQGSFDTLQFIAIRTESYTLDPEAEIELMSLLAGPGKERTLIGNRFDQSLHGGASNDVLNGKGGHDSYTGGEGDDVFYVDQAGEYVSEYAGEGFDRVCASTSWSMATFTDSRIEMLTTTSANGSAAIDLTGNQWDQTIFGNAGVNRLDGQGGNDTLYGGRGLDILTGGWSADNFVFNTVPDSSANYDRITDFLVEVDTIWLENAIFTQLGASGALSPDAFRAAAAAQDTSDRIIYNPATGGLAYDPDGVGGSGAVRFAVLAQGLNLTSGDFFII